MLAAMPRGYEEPVYPNNGYLLLPNLPTYLPPFGLLSLYTLPTPTLFLTWEI
jgi:hypothetical protein